MSTLAEQVVEQLKTDMDNVYDAGYQKGKSEGGDSYYDTFWDTFQQNGNRNEYTTAFCSSGWRNEIFKPKYDMICTSNSYQMFARPCMLEGSLTELLNRAGVKLKFVDNSYFSSTFDGSLFTEIEFNIENCNSIATAFQNCERLKTLKIATLLRTQTIGQNNFANCIALENLTIVGEIGKTNFNIQWSPLLSDVSVQNIIDCLIDLTGQTTQTLTFHADVKAKLTEEQIATITSKNWTLA